MKQEFDAIIIGAGLTGLTLAFYLKRAGKKVLVLEKEAQCGGTIKTTIKDGFTYETGPNSGTMGSPEMAELFDDLGDKCELEIAKSAAKKRWILKNKKWHALPHNIITGIKTPLFSLEDKIRLLGEPFRKKVNDPFETVAEMVVRRMGISFLEYAVNPFISGIYAGDPRRLVTKFALPKLYNLEKDYGSFILGGIKKARTKTERDKKATKKIFTTKGGMQNLINALESYIGKENIILNAENLEVIHEDKAYDITHGDHTYTATKLATTTGAQSLEELIPFVDKAELDNITNLEYAKVVQVVLGYKKWEGKKLNAFGGLIPSVENRKALGMLFPSSIFSGRAPKGGALITVFLGGTKRPDIINMSDKRLIDKSLREIRQTLSSKAKPDMIDVARYPVAIAQYDSSSLERLKSIKWIERKYEGLYLGGNIRDGIGMSDRVKQAKCIADTILQNDEKQ